MARNSLFLVGVLIIGLLFHTHICVGDSSAHKVYDVCTIGAGAAGSFASAFLKDAGLDVLLIDSFTNIGGHCDTVTDPAKPGVWNEAGVIILLNTTLSNTLGLGPFVIDQVALIKRFAGPDAIVPEPFGNVTSYIADIGRSLFLGAVPPSGPSSAEFIEQLLRYQTIMNTTLRWMDNMLEVPNPIPAELRVSMNQWIVQNNLTALYPLFLGLFYAGFGDLDSLTAFDALIQRSSSNLVYTFDPSSWFSIRNGCQTIYDGIADYLGSQSLLLSATVTSVTRPKSKHSSALVRIQGTRGGVAFQKRCRALFLAVPQTIEKLDPILDLSVFERLVFSTLRTRNVYTGRFSASGGITVATKGYTLTNIDIGDPAGLPQLPNMLGLINPFSTEAPLVHQDYFPDTVTPAFAFSFIQSKLNNLTASGAISNYTGLASWLHEFHPHWSRTFLGSPIAPHNLFDALQSLRKTFYGGAARTAANTHSVINHARLVVDEIIEFLADEDADRRRRIEDASEEMVKRMPVKRSAPIAQVDPVAVSEYLRKVSSGGAIRLAHALRGRY